MRPVEAWTPVRPEPREPRRRIWFRLGAGLGDDPRLHRAALAYVSDMALLSTAIQPHGVSWLTKGFQSASLDHALWLHEDARMDDWLLYDTDSPWAGGARGFNRSLPYWEPAYRDTAIVADAIVHERSDFQVAGCWFYVYATYGDEPSEELHDTVLRIVSSVTFIWQ
jgi:acyl-CoA thioesterase II